MIKGPENLPYEESLKEVFSPQRQGGSGDLTTIFQYLKGGYKEDGGSPITRSHMEKTWGNGSKLHWERFHLYIRKEFFTVRKINH